MRDQPEFMLDTSACIALLRGNSPPPEIRNAICGISTVVVAELWAGVYHRGGEKERQKIELLLGVVEVIAFDAAAARQTGKVLGELAREGLPIGDFDSQIAGHALAVPAILVTDNVKHFGRVKGLQVLAWVPTKKGRNSPS